MERGCPASGRTEDINNDRIAFEWTNALEGAAKQFRRNGPRDVGHLEDSQWRIPGVGFLVEDSR